MTRRHAALYLVFGLPIAGALAGSYLHLAAWLRPWMPPGWERLAWVAALALDGLILAPIVARQIVGADVPGMALRLAQGAGIGASVYVNARWGHATMAPVTRWDLADVAMGAAILPVLALIGEHAMRATLAALQAREAQEDAEFAEMLARQSAPRTLPTRHERAGAARQAMAAVAQEPAPAAPSPAPPVPQLSPVPAPVLRGAGAWPALVERHGDNPRAISEATGTPLRTVQRWRQQAAG